MSNRWSVRRWKDKWGVFDRGVCHDAFATLQEAHTFATQCAVADCLFDAGGLTRLKAMQELEEIQAYLRRYGSTGAFK